jgi:predicted transcriptional regulator
MKAVPLRIEVLSSEEQVEGQRRIVGEQLRKAARGHPVVPVRRFAFRSLDDLRSFLTPARLRLLRLIRKDHPGSVYALAKLAGRDRKAVAADLAILTELGLVRLTKPRGEGRARSVPQVPYTRIEIGVEV